MNTSKRLKTNYSFKTKLSATEHHSHAISCSCKSQRAELLNITTKYFISMYMCMYVSVCVAERVAKIPLQKVSQNQTNPFEKVIRMYACMYIYIYTKKCVSFRTINAE